MRRTPDPDPNPTPSPNTGVPHRNGPHKNHSHFVVTGYRDRQEAVITPEQMRVAFNRFFTKRGIDPEAEKYDKGFQYGKGKKMSKQTEDNDDEQL